ncbi:MAG: methylenetetrahydrofolate reductase, partial [Alphaproteobacteria bacterium]
NYQQLVGFAGGCGAGLPDWLGAMFDGLEDDPGTRKLIGAAIAVDQCRRLQANGVNEFHFYTLNRADLTYAVCLLLGARPRTAADKARTAADQARTAANQD